MEVIQCPNHDRSFRNGGGRAHGQARAALAISSVVLVLSFGTGLAVARAGPAGAASPATGWIRFGHFVPSQGPVDVTVGTTVLGTDLVFRSVTPYISVPSGNQTVTVRVSGAPTSAAPLVVGEADVDPRRSCHRCRRGRYRRDILASQRRNHRAPNVRR